MKSSVGSGGSEITEDGIVNWEFAVSKMLTCNLTGSSILTVHWVLMGDRHLSFVSYVTWSVRSAISVPKALQASPASSSCAVNPVVVSLKEVSLYPICDTYHI